MKNNAKWWLDFTLDRLYSERWLMEIKDWEWGVHVELYLNGNVGNDYVPYQFEMCFNLALVTK